MTKKCSYHMKRDYKVSNINECLRKIIVRHLELFTLEWMTISQTTEYKSVVWCNIGKRTKRSN